MVMVNLRFKYAILSLLFLAACSDDDTNCVTVSGNLVSETRELADFHSVSFEGVGNLFITQESPQSVRIETRQSIMPLLKTRVNNGQLNIELEDCITGQIDKLDIFISIPDIENLEIDGVGSITGQNAFDLDNLEIEINGVGDVTVNGTTDRLEINSSGVGNVHAFELVSNICEVNITGSGNVEVTAETDLDVIISGTGNVYYKGTPSIESNISGSGNLIDAN